MIILGILFVVLGVVSVIYNKAGAELYAEFQKGWGLQGRAAIVTGRLIGILGGLMFVALGIRLVLN